MPGIRIGEDHVLLYPAFLARMEMDGRAGTQRRLWMLPAKIALFSSKVLSTFGFAKVLFDLLKLLACYLPRGVSALEYLERCCWQRFPGSYLATVERSDQQKYDVDEKKNEDRPEDKQDGKHPEMSSTNTISAKSGQQAGNTCDIFHVNNLPLGCCCPFDVLMNPWGSFAFF
jgi:hypothetical protein